jgi:lactoylglutathione lyase
MKSSSKSCSILSCLALAALSAGLAAVPPSGPGEVLLAGNLTGPQHLGIPVTDIARSRAFYERLGFKQVMTAEVPEGTGTIKVAMMDFNGFVIEIFELPAEDQLGIRDRKDGHIDHIALNVLDVDRAFRELKAAGLDVLEEKPVFLPFWEKGVLFFNVRGPDGERVEFAERLK